MLVIMVFAVGCELEDVISAESEDIVIAEVYLRTDVQVQRAVLHRTRQSDDSLLSVPGARIEVTNAAGAVLHYVAAADSLCVTPPQPPRTVVPGSCYISDPQPRFDIISGERYSLRITLPDGRALTGSTTVPSNFSILRPVHAVCALPPGTRFEVVWTASLDAWVYPTETNLYGLRDILEQQGIEIEQEPVRLFGLSISSADTTIMFPSEFGLFDRFDDDLTAALVAIQQGLPSGVVADVVIGAADRNYVNWERGGNFNPSGVIRIGNLRGDGAGVFGSLVVKHFQVRVGSSEHPPC